MESKEIISENTVPLGMDEHLYKVLVIGDFGVGKYLLQSAEI